jgi:hypothetical protein
LLQGRKDRDYDRKKREDKAEQKPEKKAAALLGCNDPSDNACDALNDNKS